MTHAVTIERKTAAGRPSATLLELLLVEQQSLSAVEQFSEWHDARGLHDPAHAQPASDGNAGHDQAVHYRGLLPAAELQDGLQYAFSVDLDACSGCKACVVACHNLNGLEPEETWRRVGMMVDPRGGLPIVQHVTTACHHCEDPACLAGCPTLAYEKHPDTGIVKHLDDQCFGCQYCTMMCPYEVPQYSSSLGIVRKCDMCTQRLAVGEAPACVQACPNQAISISLVPKSAAARGDAFGAGTGLLDAAPPPQWTRPTTQFHSRWKAPSAASPIDAAVDHPHHAHLPLVAMLVLTQACCGVFVALAVWATVTPGMLLAEYDATPVVSFAAASLAAAVIGVFAVHLAMLHLGRPHLFYRAALGWRRSWLSREAIGFGGVMAVWMSAGLGYGLRMPMLNPLFVRLPRLALGPLELAAASVWPAVFAAIAGLAGVFCSAMIYVVTRRTLWNATRTFSLFGGTVAAAAIATPAICFAAAGDAAGWVAAALATAAVFSAASMWPLADSWFAASTPDRVYAETFSPAAFVYRQGRLLRESFTPSVVSIAGLHAAVLALAGLLTVLGDVGIVGLLLAAAACICLLFAHFAARRLYFAAVVTYRMPGGGV